MKKKTQAIEDRKRVEEALGPIGAELDRWAWERLQDARPELAQSVAAAVAGGVEPQDIRQYVSDRTRRPELSRWVEQAARWLAASEA